MAFFRKAGSILGRSVSSYIGQEISFSKQYVFQAIRCMSSSKLFIGGLSSNMDDKGLRDAFKKYGDVAEARVIVDRDSGRSLGYGFVTFASVDESSAAIQALDQQELDGHRIRVDYANDRVRGYGSGSFRNGDSSGGFIGGGSGSNSDDHNGDNSSYGGNGQDGGGGSGDCRWRRRR